MYIKAGSTNYDFKQMPDIGITYNRQFSNKVSEAVGGELHSFNPHTGKKVWNISLTNISSAFKTNLEAIRDEVLFNRDTITFWDSLNLVSRTTLAEEVDATETEIDVTSATNITAGDYIRLSSKWGEDVLVAGVSTNTLTVVRGQGNNAINGGQSVHLNSGTVYELPNYTLRFVSGLQFQEISIGRYSTSFVLKEVAPS